MDIRYRSSKRQGKAISANGGAGSVNGDMFGRWRLAPVNGAR